MAIIDPISTLEVATLDGNNGFEITSIDNGDYLGISVSDAGDFNGDGIDDLIIGANRANGDKGESYVLFGKLSFASSLQPDSGSSGNDFLIFEDGISASGRSVSSAGDINGDGVDDIIIGAPLTTNNFKGLSYIVFGQTTFGHPSSSSTFSLSTLSSHNNAGGFVIPGVSVGNINNELGKSVSDAGDVNADGFDDIIIGAPGVDKSYVIFGKSELFDPVFSVEPSTTENNTNTNKFDTFIGDISNSQSGTSISGAGDINGDGIDDFLISAPDADPGSTHDGGQVYVVFGTSSTPTQRLLSLSFLNGNNGFVIRGESDQDQLGISVSDAGDVNGDGIDDIIIGTDARGKAYVVFGSSHGFSSSLDVSSLDGNDGFRIENNNNSSSLGFSVSSAGDFNGDGIDDIIVGAPSDGDGGRGESYVIFGSRRGFSSSLDVSSSSFNGHIGFTITGANAQDRLGQSVSGAGDINNDAFDDIIVGANRANNGGESYVIFGRPTRKITGTPQDDTLVGNGKSEFIHALEGNDIINGNDGDDNISGGLGNDTINGGNGRDTIKGDEGNDRIIGFNGNDSLFGNNGSDSLFGEAGDDIINGNEGNDSIFGGFDDDTLSGDSGNDFFSGGVGNDSVLGDSGNDILNGDGGNDFLGGGNDNDILNGGGGHDTLDGGSGIDLLRGGNDNDILDGGDDNDDLFGDGGNDKLNGGAGNDILFGGFENDTLNGDAGDDNLNGGNDNDIVNGGDGNDTVRGFSW